MGPSLLDRHAHHDIHDAARAEMELGTQILFESAGGEDAATALRLARELALGWRLRVLAHADAEEQDLFPQVQKLLPGLSDQVVAAMRDHELMRLLLGEVEQELDREGRVTQGVLERLQALLQIQRLHSLFEEETFLPELSGALKGAKKPTEGAQGA